MFPVDMAGFALQLHHFLAKCPNLRFPYKPGLLEDEFLKGLGIPMDEFQLLAENCTKIYVWHTKSQIPSFEWFNQLTGHEKERTNLGKLIIS